MTARASGTDDVQLLHDARCKAQALLANLVAQQEDLNRANVPVAPDALARGRAAFARAIESARQTVDNIEQALRRHNA